MFLKNISKRKILLLIINALISILMVSCIVFLYYYLPSSSHTTTFTVEKDNSIHITKNRQFDSGKIISANVRISASRRSQEEPLDDTIYIDNENYGDESYDNSDNFAEIPVTAPATTIERSQFEDDDFYYENYNDETETDDEDIVSSGDGKIVLLNVKKPPKNRGTVLGPASYIENVYSVSSEIVSNLKSQYNVDDMKQINKPDKNAADTESDKDETNELQKANAKGRRLSGNNKSLVERSRQLLLCESARTGELCRMLFKGTPGTG